MLTLEPAWQIVGSRRTINFMIDACRSAGHGVRDYTVKDRPRLAKAMKLAKRKVAVCALTGLAAFLIFKLIKLMAMPYRRSSWGRTTTIVVGGEDQRKELKISEVVGAIPDVEDLYPEAKATVCHALLRHLQIAATLSPRNADLFGFLKAKAQRWQRDQGVSDEEFVDFYAPTVALAMQMTCAEWTALAMLAAPSAGAARDYITTRGIGLGQGDTRRLYVWAFFERSIRFVSGCFLRRKAWDPDDGKTLS
jgi:hypothetical protein